MSDDLSDLLPTEAYNTDDIVDETSIELFGVKVRYHILKDGRRMVNAADADRAFAYVLRRPKNAPLTEDEKQSLLRFKRFCRGDHN